jgi:hypothetical protein
MERLGIELTGEVSRQRTDIEGASTNHSCGKSLLSRARILSSVTGPEYAGEYLPFEEGASKSDLIFRRGRKIERGVGCLEHLSGNMSEWSILDVTIT